MINKEWHQNHKMPVKATDEQRIEWHLEHSKHCNCRPIPQNLLPICQSCGMPMKIESDFGTNADKGKNKEYCTYCYHDGKFTKPGITMEQMIKGCVGIMVKFGVPEEQAKKQMETLIPTLKRWKE